MERKITIFILQADVLGDVLVVELLGLMRDISRPRYFMAGLRGREGQRVEERFLWMHRLILACDGMIV